MSSSDRMTRFMLKFSCVSGVILLPIFSYITFGDLIYARSTATWPTVEGKVKESAVVETSGTERVGKHAERFRMFQPRISYVYSVDGKEFVGSQITPKDTTFREQNRASEIASRYAVGKAVKVSFKPSSPGDSVLEPIVPDFLYTALWIPAIPLGMALLPILLLKTIFRLPEDESTSPADCVVSSEK